MLVIAGAAALLCCGGVGLLSYRMMPTESTEPAAIRATTIAIGPLDIDEKIWKPAKSFKQNVDFIVVKVMTNQFVCWNTQDGQGRLYLLRIQLKSDDAQAEMPADQQAQVEQSLAGYEQMCDMHILDIREADTKTLKFLGQDCEFHFAKCQKSGDDQPWRQVTGRMAVDRGFVSIKIQLPEEQYDEAAVIRMLTGKEPAADVDPPAPTPEGGGDAPAKQGDNGDADPQKQTPTGNAVGSASEKGAGEDASETGESGGAEKPPGDPDRPTNNGSC